MKNKFIVLSIGMFLGVFLLASVFAVEVSVCCEKTKTGVWCQNSPAGSCDSTMRSAPSSCDATSFCRMGCCYDSQEGTCMKNTPEKVCQNNGGVWGDSSECEIPQCELGCCVLGDQAAFVSLTRCKRLSNIYGLENDFRKEIKDEIQCIASVTSEVKGACVFEKEFETTCRFITKKECSEGETSGAYPNASFHEEYLCSDESLGTNCAPSEKTTCLEGRDEVYFTDTCGNMANIYDSSKIKIKTYWNRIVSKDESCNADDSKGNANSKTCGNCDYFLGSVCKKAETGKDSNPQYGDYICRDLGCEWNGKTYQHGETFCADSLGIDKNLPGSRYFRLVCYNGEVTVEPCADFRQQICLETDVNGFMNAACVSNRWHDCYGQLKKKDCENTDKRDCVWLPGMELSAVAETTGTSTTDSVLPFRGSTPAQSATSSTTQTISRDDGACVPKYSPGFETGEAQQICSMASTQCTVKFEKGLIGKEKCVKNCECLEDSWEAEKNKLCVSIGDCGDKNNYRGYAGYGEGTNILINGKEKSET
ncbi:MAG: hypothetical protein AABX30_03325 [Nanoarchaeota archaeon]